MRRIVAFSLAAAVLAFGTALAQDGKLSIKTGETAPPAELDKAVAKLLAPQTVRLLDGGDKVVGEFWFRKEVPAEATPEQVKNGLTFREVKQSEIIGAVRFDQDWYDYRKQKIKAGVYTLRLGYQPQDGDHMGSSLFQDFLVVLKADQDKSPAALDPMDMVKKSMKAIGTGHPGVLMLAANPLAKNPPALKSLPNEHWVVNLARDVLIEGKKAGTMGMSIYVAGHAE